MSYESVIGLEVHVQLNTKTKIFCSCPLTFGNQPNTAVCPICLAYPGVLPVLNKEALLKAVKAGLALHSTVNLFSQFDRKNYFYPDLPKGYQITQNFYPIVTGGHVSIHLPDGEQKNIRIHHMHLEEDAGKLTHNEFEDFSRVDLNRAGTPLLEIVSEPDIRTSEEAYFYLRQLRTIMKYIDVSDVNLEEGSLRCDANVSVRKKGAQEFGTKVEIKNLNSFNGIRKAIDYEIERQIAVLESGGVIEQETRLFDAQKNITQGMRSKGMAADYRYFPEPDLGPVEISQQFVDEIAQTLPEHPFSKRLHFHNELGLPLKDCIVLTDDLELASYFEHTLQHTSQDAKKTANWILTEVMSRMNELKISPNQFAEKLSPKFTAELLDCVKEGIISGKIAKDLFDDMLETGKSASVLIEEKGLKQMTDSSELERIVDQIIADNPAQVEQFKSGKDKIFGFFVGQLMKATQGQANPELANKLFRDKLK
ncbi:MAG: Asp-tRNA(Asn)/Glu-tRNA(Gln) amidotransferase subunit GatB [Brevinemataceae bacterium]